jgi:hypothetical protein
MGPATLFVPSSFEAQARLVLESVERDDDASEDATAGPDEE